LLFLKCKRTSFELSNAKSVHALTRIILGRPGFMEIVASGGGTPYAVYSNPFAFRTVWAAGEERNVISALAASVSLLPVTMPGAN